jgi:hypothetical protein
MKQEIIKDKYGNKLALMETSGEKTVLYDKNNVQLGAYFSINNFTVDKSGKNIGSGNLLMNLIPKQ